MVRVFGLACAAFALVVGALPASAATLIVKGGQLVGARNVVVGNMLLDARFDNRPCTETFSGCDERDDFDFFDLASARDAGEALLAEVLIDGPDGNFDSLPDGTLGCDFAAGCFVQFPFSITLPTGIVELGMVSVGNSTSEGGDQVSFGPITTPDTDSITRTMVVFSLPGTTVVPLPGSALLLLTALGLTAAGSLRRRRSGG